MVRDAGERMEKPRIPVDLAGVEPAASALRTPRSTG